MQKYLKYLLFVALLISTEINAQTIRGKVTNTDNQPLSGANVVVMGYTNGVYTNIDGEFVLIPTKSLPVKIIASYTGYKADTILVTDFDKITFKLLKSNSLTDVVVYSQKDGIVLSDNSIQKTEQITQTELKKAACCDLAGCFETQASVQPQTTNVITNAKELRILGLSGVYNQILIDGFPLIQGLSFTYGISSLPGSVVDNIYISKGANSVLQGFESISGQINVETKEPDATDKLFVNAYMNSFFEKHLNTNFAVKNSKWSNLTSVHIVQPAERTDKDKDNFLDLPLLKRYMIGNRWKLNNETDSGLNCQIGIRFFNEQRTGGQTTFNANSDKGSNSVYGQTVQINQPELWCKTSYTFNDKHNLVFFASAYKQNQNSFFGTIKYKADQTNVYSNIQYEYYYGDHNIKTGFSFRSLQLKEDIDFTDTVLKRSYGGLYNRNEKIPGWFAENTLHLLQDKVTWITGIRADNHNQYNWRLTPRTMVKYDMNASTIIRANIGLGWRTVNLFSENINLLVSSRDIIFKEFLQPEKALNYGCNIIKKFGTGNPIFSGHFTVDLYRTIFQNQIFPDYDTDPTKAFIQNFTGRSISNGIQAEVLMKLNKIFECKTGYNYLDVYRIINNIKVALPFNPSHKILTTFSYKPLSNKMHIDFNLHWYGRQRLPDTKNNPREFVRADYSKPYTVFSGQFTYKFKNIEVYTGCENIFNFRQLQPIISWQNPFSPYFDTSSVWGPTRGREIYTGIRFIMKSK